MRFISHIRKMHRTVFECGFSWITSWLAVKVSQTCVTFQSHYTLIPPAAQTMLSVWACVWPPLSPTHHHLVLSLFHVCLRPPVSTPPVHHGNIPCYGENWTRGLCLHKGFYNWFLEKRKIFWSRIQQWGGNMPLMASQMAFCVTAGVNNTTYCLFLP